MKADLELPRRLVAVPSVTADIAANEPGRVTDFLLPCALAFLPASLVLLVVWFKAGLPFGF